MKEQGVRSVLAIAEIDEPRFEAVANRVDAGVDRREPGVRCVDLAGCSRFIAMEDVELALDVAT